MRHMREVRTCGTFLVIGNSSRCAVSELWGHGGGWETGSYVEPLGTRVLSVVNSGNGIWSYWSKVVWEQVAE